MSTVPVITIFVRHSADCKYVGDASVVTLKPAIRDHFKTGHRDWPQT